MPPKLHPCGTPAAYQRHLRNRETACDDCKAAWARKSAKEYQANPEAAHRRTQRYKKRHPEKIREIKRRYRKSNAEKLAEYHRKYNRGYYQRRNLGRYLRQGGKAPSGNREEIYQWFLEHVAPLMKGRDF